MLFFGKKEEPSKNYRKTGLDTNMSNYGWYTCVHCGKKMRKGDVEIDHIIPRSKGGTNDPKNLQCLCKHCNRSKQADTSRTKQDLKNRKVTYGQNQRAPYFKEKIKKAKGDIREKYLSQCSDEELKMLMNDPELSAIMVDIRREARKRKLI